MKSSRGLRRKSTDCLSQFALDTNLTHNFGHAANHYEMRQSKIYNYVYIYLRLACHPREVTTLTLAYLLRVENASIKPLSDRYNTPAINSTHIILRRK